MQMKIMENRKGYEPVTIKIHISNKGIVLEEISLIAIEKNTNKIIAIGEETRKIEESGNQEILMACPLKWGIIADYTASVKMFEYLLQKAIGHKLSFYRKPKIVICIPKDTTEVERKAFTDVFYQMKTREVYLSKLSFEETILGVSSKKIITIGMFPIEAET